MEAAIILERVSKSYGSTTALQEISFSCPPGKICGLIGPDGAGKTTLFRLLCTLLELEQGEAYLCGLSVKREWLKIRQIVGYMPGRFSLYQDLTVEENLQFFARVFSVKVESNYRQIEEIYRQLEPFKDRRAGKLSGGMKQKLALCCALIHRPQVLLLDEPTTGVDPVSRKEFWQMLARLKNDGLPILVSTPYMDEAAECDSISLIQQGKILQSATPQKIVQSYPYPLFALQSPQIYRLQQKLKQLPHTRFAYLFGEAIHYSGCTKLEQLQELLDQLGETQVRATSIEPTIEDCFMALSSKESL